MTVATRLTASPMAPLHVDGARVALVDWLFARANGGRFILRIDDLDAEAPPAVPAVEKDLAWLGLAFDERHKQSDRRAHYELALRTLRQADKVYACYETPDELAAGAEAMLAKGLPAVYRRQRYRPSEAEQRAFEEEGRPAYFRFELEEGEIAWDDPVLGARAFQSGGLEDPVVRHAEGCPSALFASAVDDVELGITHVIRSEARIGDTPMQIQIMRALGGFLPSFVHLPRLLDAGGEELGEGRAPSIAAFRERGIAPAAVRSMLAALGMRASPESSAELEDLALGFTLSDLAQAPPRFDPLALERVNGGPRPQV
jgi:glutamyl-tRNA synthetase